MNNQRLIYKIDRARDSIASVGGAVDPADLDTMHPDYDRRREICDLILGAQVLLDTVSNRLREPGAPQIS